MADDRKLEEDQIVQKLVPDPAQGPPDATVLRGYLGKGPEKGSWRLYVSAALDEYVELEATDILHSEKLPDDKGTIVWVPKTLTLRYVRVHSDQVQADFLHGHIASTRLQPGLVKGAIPPGNLLAPTAPIPCSLACLSHAPCISIDTCVSFTVGCPSRLVCHTAAIPCIAPIFQGSRVSAQCTPVALSRQKGVYISNIQICDPTVDACPSAFTACYTFPDGGCYPQTEHEPVE